jgi:hypothetical protein
MLCVCNAKRVLPLPVVTSKLTGEEKYYDKNGNVK